MLLDTHTFIWSLLDSRFLSTAARDALSGATSRWISAASIYEMVYKARQGKWPEVEELADLDLDPLLAAAGFDVLPATGGVMHRAAALDWAHRDPFDRIIVATALSRGLAVVSKDQALDGNGAAGWERIW